MEGGSAIIIAMNDTYKVLRIKGRKPNSPLNGFQFAEVSKDHRLSSFIKGNDLYKRLMPITQSSVIVRIEMPNMKYLAVLSLIALTTRILF